MKVLILLAILWLPNYAQSNENQRNNEYYDRSQCIRQVFSDFEDEYKKCIETKTKLDCVPTDKEINESMIVYCGEEDKQRENNRLNRL